MGLAILHGHQCNLSLLSQYIEMSTVVSGDPIRTSMLSMQRAGVLVVAIAGRRLGRTARRDAGADLPTISDGLVRLLETPPPSMTPAVIRVRAKCVREADAQPDSARTCSIGRPLSELALQRLGGEIRHVPNMRATCNPRRDRRVQECIIRGAGDRGGQRASAIRRRAPRRPRERNPLRESPSRDHRHWHSLILSRSRVLPSPSSFPPPSSGMAARIPQTHNSGCQAKPVCRPRHDGSTIALPLWRGYLI